MRYPASEKLETIRLVEQSHLPAKRTLDMLGVPRTTFYRWYDRYLKGGAEALEDKSPKPGREKSRITRFWQAYRSRPREIKSGAMPNDLRSQP